MENGNAAQESPKEGWNCKADQRLFIALQRILLDCMTPLSRYLKIPLYLENIAFYLLHMHQGKGQVSMQETISGKNTFPEHFCQFCIVSFTSFLSLLETS